MRSRNSLPAIGAGLLLLTLAIYAPVFHAGYVWDDDAWLTGNPAITSPGGLHAIWTSVPRMQYYPLTFTSFWLEHRLWGFAPLGYHLVNVLLHAANAILVGLILRSLRVPGAFFAAALFAVHPMHVESVAWVTERKNVLSGLFFLGSALAYLEWERDRKRGLYVASLALFACALLAKTATAVLPAALAVVAAWRRWPPRARDLAPLGPFVLLAGAMASVTIVLEKGMVAVVGTDFGFTAGERLLVAARAFLFYPLKLLVPYPLIFNYPRFDVRDASIVSLWPVAAVIVLALGAIALWRRGSRGVACAVIVYAVGIAPALGFVDVYAFRYSFVADHFAYLASIPLLALVAAAGTTRLREPIARALGVAALVALGVLTWNQARAYHDEATLWNDTIAKNPDSWIAHHNLATIRSRAGAYEAAIAGFTEALRCKPSAAESYTGRGFAYGKSGRVDLAVADLDRAIELDPTLPQAYLNRGEMLVTARRFEAALPDLDRFLGSNPNYAPAHRLRGVAHAQLGQDEAAVEDLSRAIRLEPEASDLYDMRAAILTKMGRFDAALADSDVAVKLRPSNATTFMLRGSLFKRIDGNTVRACQEWQRACRLGDCTLYERECVKR